MSMVSVVVPAYNGAPYLAATLDSILASDHPNFEVVVLDNASTDATPDILASYDDPRVVVHRNPAVLPLAENWQAATELATGELIKIVCADDLIRRDALRLQAEVLDADPTVALVASRRHFIDDRGLVMSYNRGLPGLIGRHSAKSVARRITWLGINPIGESAGIMFRRQDFLLEGGWNAELVYPMDVDLWLRLLAHGDMIGQPEALAAFRISTTSLSSRHDEHQFAEQAQFVDNVTADPRWRHAQVTRTTSRLITKAGWVAWSARTWMWTSGVLGAPRPLGEPAPLRRRLMPY